MKYRVIWDQRAFHRLLKQWNDAGNPESAIRAFDAIEKLLSEDAEAAGESRDDGRRILFLPPIGIVFRPNSRTGEVRILDAWLIRASKP